jgi:hypothetical protein
MIRFKGLKRIIDSLLAWLFDGIGSPSILTKDSSISLIRNKFAIASHTVKGYE